MDTSAEKTISERRTSLIVWGLPGVFIAFSALPRASMFGGLWWSIIAWGVGLFAVVSLLTRYRGGVQLSVQIRRPHYVQLMVQGGVFLYWGWYWEEVYREFPLILSQVAFAYVVEMLVCWHRHGQWRIGFSPWPIVFSTNLFMWFRDDYFAAQYLMIALAYLSREYIRWRRDGREVHVFNPSAFGLCAVSLFLIAFELPHLTWGEQISVTLAQPPHAYAWIFAMGLVVQIFFRVTLVTFSAAATTWLVGSLYFLANDTYMYIDTTIPIAVFLGMNLLVTDPASSPKSNMGKVLFGALYGLAIFFMYDVLRDMGRPSTPDDPGLAISWMDKLLFLPFLNLLARPLDRVGQWLELRSWSVGEPRTNLVHVGAWAVVFFLMHPSLVEHPGRDGEFWSQRCTPEDSRACDNLAVILDANCERGEGDACYLLGDHYRDKSSVDDRVILARLAYERACTLSSGPGCRALGENLAFDDPQRQMLLENGCRFDDGPSCVLASMGVGPRSAAAFQEKACDLGEGRGCFLLGQSLRAKGAQHSFVNAIGYYRKGCELQDDLACTLYGTMLWVGDGAKASPDEARRILERSCQRSERACAQLRRLEQGG